MEAPPSGRARDRRSAERADLDLREMLTAPGTRVLEVVGDRCAVLEPGDAVGDAPSDALPGPCLRWRDAHADDTDAEVLVFLDRDADGTASVAVGLSDRETTEEPGVSWSTLREVGAWLPTDDAVRFMTAQGMILWHRTHRFCPRCGAPTAPTHAGWVRRCTQDGRESYPRTDPAVIMAVRDEDDRLLLARSPQWPDGRRSVLAGFVEPGESLEDAVRREVAEEVGVPVGRVEYAGSQPWPFPASLMLGFHAWADDIRLSLDPGEIAEAEWFTRGELAEAVASGRVMLPGRLSIARRLVEAWYGSALYVPQVDDRGGSAWHRPSS